MSRFLHLPTQEKLTSVGAMVLDRLRRVGTSVAAIAGMASTSHSPVDDIPENSPDLATNPATSQKDSIQAATQRAEEEQQRKRHAAQMLNEHGIKVRDFAYESTLPPVPKARISAAGKRRPLRRAWDECFGGEGEGDGPADGREHKRQKLERTATEPIPSSQNMPPSQNPGFGDLETIQEASSSRDNSPDEEMNHQGLHRLDVNHPDVVYISWPAGLDSNEPRPEGWIDTPPITPGGSYVPLPEVEEPSRQGSLMDIDFVDIPFELPRAEPVAAEEPNPTQAASSSQASVQTQSNTSLFSSLTSLSSSSSTFTPSPSHSPSRPRRHSLRDISKSYNTRRPTPSSSTSGPRYLLRNKVATTKPGSSPVPRAGSRRLSGSRPSTVTRSSPHKLRSSVAKRTTGSVKASPPKPVRRSPRTSAARGGKR